MFKFEAIVLQNILRQRKQNAKRHSFDVSEIQATVREESETGKNDDFVYELLSIIGGAIGMQLL